jgi:integron integrase
MLPLPPSVRTQFQITLHQQAIPLHTQSAYLKWLRYYWDFCHKYHLSPTQRESLAPFLNKLQEKHQTQAQQAQAAQAIRLYQNETRDTAGAEPFASTATASGSKREAESGGFRSGDAGGSASRPTRTGQGASWKAEFSRLAETLRRRQYDPTVTRAYTKWLRKFQAFTRSKPPEMLSSEDAGEFLTSLTARRSMTLSKQLQAYDAVLLFYRDVVKRTFEVARPVRSVASGAPKPRSASSQEPAASTKPSGLGASWQAEYAKLTEEIRTRHYSPSTLKTYRTWARRFQTFTKSKAPNTLTVEDVKAFLSYLAVERDVSASTQNQAFNALLFFFRHVLGKEFGEIDGVVRAKRRPYIPVVLSRAEIEAILQHLEPPYDLVVKLLYGCGLRVSECLHLRVQCFNFDAGVLTVHDGKGQKDRTVPLPETILPELQAQLDRVRVLHRQDLDKAYAGVFLVHALEKKYPRAAKEFCWQWFFPAKQLTYLEKTGEYRRYHLHKTHVQKAIKQAVQKAQICKRASAHTFRHCFASHLLQANYDIRTIQELLGHSDVKITMMYTHTLNSTTRKEAKSPLDLA